MGTLKDVNTTSIEEAIGLGCHTMQNVFDADVNHIPFFRSVVYPASEAHLGFSAHHSESHVPGRHLNALLNAADLIDVDITEAAIEKHRRAAFLSFSGPVALALNRTEVGGPLVNFCPHNLREGLHALYALTAFRDDGRPVSWQSAASPTCSTCGALGPAGTRGGCSRSDSSTRSARGSSMARRACWGRW